MGRIWVNSVENILAVNANRHWNFLEGLSVFYLPLSRFTDVLEEQYILQIFSVYVAGYDLCFIHAGVLY